MGNTLPRGTWTEKMYREREREINEAIKAMKLRPVVATFEEEWCLKNIFKHEKIEDLIKEHTVWGLDVGYNLDNTKNVMHQLKIMQSVSTKDTWFHLVLKMGDNFWVPRFRTNLRDGPLFYKVAQTLDYAKIVCVLNDTMPVSADLSSMWVYPTLYDNTIYFILTPNHLDINNELTFIPKDNMYLLNLTKDDTAYTLQNKIKGILENASRPMWKDIKQAHSLCFGIDTLKEADSSQSHILKDSSS